MTTQVFGSDPFVGVQLGSHSVFEEGAERVLDTLQKTARVNAVFVYSHAYADAGPPMYFSVPSAGVLDQVSGFGPAGVIYTDSLATSGATEQRVAAGNAVRKRR